MILARERALYPWRWVWRSEEAVMKAVCMPLSGNRKLWKLIRANVQKFHGNWEDIHIVEGEAPEAFEGLPAPTHAFIGGSGGKMKEIIGTLLNLNPAVRIVANAITLETVSEILACMKEYGFEDGELLQVQVSPVKQLGSYHMPIAQNPVYIAVMQHPVKDDVEEIEWLDS